ncbi:DUF5017 domain-containing protein [Lutibacter sp. A64]|uniref:choice-of-anchor J domain-containing protein n=1 Tax=Lutibacter sp. A64 TaxID=2918526 RepID=UPI001F067C25|nr:choice-of-anchor J domain-containing protein [Lutibacter sp. A64]UMB53134.1 DUF5017 domain-containing protein [Lutibacter sp. A64]
MKKIIYLIMAIGLVFTACDPMDDIYADLDAQESAVVGNAEYTLTDEDYDDLELGYGSFNSLDDAKSLLPSFLADAYPYWGKNSSVLVGFDLYVGYAPGVSDYTNATSYSLANMDYPRGSENAVAFFPEEDPADYLGDILNANIDAPTEGNMVLAKYKVYKGEPVAGVSNFFEETFNGSLNSWESISVIGDQSWYATSYSNDEYAKASGYSSGSRYENEDWLISPEIDLTNQINATLEIRQALNFGGADLVKILISTDYSTGGDIAASTWNELELQNIPDGTSYDFYVSDPYALTDYEGETIHIAFKYVSDGTNENTSTWQIDNVVVKVPGVEGDTAINETFLTYSEGEWEPSEGVYFIQDADFDSMGEGYGQPGQYNNFGSSTPPDDYLPTFLNLKYPYALEGDELIVVYDYYSSSSGAQLRGNLYTKSSGAWSGYESTISTTLQFGHDGANWVPDNTIKYTLTGADYDYIVETYKDIYSGGVANLSSYGNISAYNWAPDEILDVLSGVLLNNFPDSEEGQKFIVTYATYDGSSHDVSLNVILEGGKYVLNN